MKRKKIIRSMRVAKGGTRPSGKSRYARKKTTQCHGTYGSDSPFVPKKTEKRNRLHPQGKLQEELIRNGLA